MGKPYSAYHHFTSLLLTSPPAKMHASLSAFSSVCLLFASHIRAISAITLNQFQPINGFSQACVSAYNTPLSGCTPSDFESGSCSTTCIAFLEALTQVLNSECGGTSAYPNTLIGSFFKNEGTSTLCRNVLDGSGGTNYASTAVVEQAGASTSNSYPSPSTVTKPSYTSDTLPILSAAPSQPLLSTHSTATTASAEATTTQIAVVNTTVLPQSPSFQPSPSTTDSRNTATSATSALNDSKTVSSGVGSTGGSPLDVGSSAASHNARIEAWVLSLMVGSTGLTLLF